MELIKGKRYFFPVCIPSDGRIKNGLFTGEYDKRGCAILMTKDGVEWHVPAENCRRGKAEWVR